jgi:hypothetical protein
LVLVGRVGVFFVGVVLFFNFLLNWASNIYYNTNLALFNLGELGFLIELLYVLFVILFVIRYFVIGQK